MKLEKEISFNLPEGNYSGRIETARVKVQNNNGQERQLFRMVLDADAPHSVFDLKAGISYQETQNRQLREDLSRILGSDIVFLTDSEGNILPDRLNILEGKRVQFRIEHVKSPGHKLPYCNVVDLRPAPSTTPSLN